MYYHVLLACYHASRRASRCGARPIDTRAPCRPNLRACHMFVYLLDTRVVCAHPPSAHVVALIQLPSPIIRWRTPMLLSDLRSPRSIGRFVLKISFNPLLL